MSVKKLTKKTSINKLSLEKVTADKINEIIDALGTTEKAYGSFYNANGMSLMTPGYNDVPLTHDTAINNLTHTNTESTITITKAGKYKIIGGASVAFVIPTNDL